MYLLVLWTGELSCTRLLNFLNIYVGYLALGNEHVFSNTLISGSRGFSQIKFQPIIFQKISKKKWLNKFMIFNFNYPDTYFIYGINFIMLFSLLKTRYREFKYFFYI